MSEEYSFPQVLSDLAGTIVGMDHPWRRLREHADWSLCWAMLPGDLLGVTDFTTKTITLDSRLQQAERRCTIAHELEHVRRGPMPADPVLAAREELAIDKAVAWRLIEIKALGDVLTWTQDIDEAAEELWVDRATLLTRLRHLQPAERAYLEQRLAHLESV